MVRKEASTREIKEGRRERKEDGKEGGKQERNKRR